MSDVRHKCFGRPQIRSWNACYCPGHHGHTVFWTQEERLDRTHIVFISISREYDGCHHDSLIWVAIWTRVYCTKGTCRMNTKGVRCSSDLFTVCPNFVQHNQMFIRQNRPPILSSSHVFKILADVRPIHMQCSDEHTGLLFWCVPDKEHYSFHDAMLHKRLFLSLLCTLMMCTNNQVHYGPMVILVCYSHYITSLSSLCRRIWRHDCQIHSAACMSKIK